jgi:hypothetical protein
MARSMRVRTFGIVVVALILHGCATKVQVPPRLELAAWSTIGIVGFGGDADAELAELATGRFLQMLHHAQPGVRILELGPEARLLSELGHSELDFEAIRALGARFGVDALFIGALELSQLKPDVRLSQGLTSVRAAANVNGRLATKLLETRSGASVWSRSAHASANVARIGASTGGGLPSFRVGDPRDAYAGLVPQLVDQLGHDFYPTWTKQR